MRIALVSGTHLGRANALFEHRMLRVAGFLQEKGWEARIFGPSADFRNLRERRVNVKGVDVTYTGQAPHLDPIFGSVRRLGAVASLLSVAASTLRTVSELRKFDPDVIHFFTTQPASLLQGLIAKTLLGKKVALDCDDLFGRGGKASASYINPILASVADVMERRFPFFFDALSVCSHYLSGKFSRHSNLHLIPNQFSPNEFEAFNPHTERFPRSILVLSGLDSEYDLDIAIDAMPRVLEKYKDARLVFVGDGNYRKALERMVSDRGISPHVEFKGRVPRDDVLSCLRECGVGIIPMRDKPLNRARCPLKMIEYMAAGMPMVCSGLGEASHYLKHLDSAYLAKPGSPESLALGINKVLGDPALSDRMGRNARHIALEFFSSEKINPLYKSLYESLKH